MDSDENQAKYAGWDFLEQDGFLYYRVCRVEDRATLYPLFAIDSAMEVVDKNRPKISLTGGNGNYNVWTSISKFLKVLKYKVSK